MHHLALQTNYQRTINTPPTQLKRTTNAPQTKHRRRTQTGETMNYAGSEAELLDDSLARAQEPLRSERPAFEVVTGGGLDAKARQGVSPFFLSCIKMAAIIVAFVVALGGVRVTLTAATVTTLQANAQLQTQIEDACDYCDALQVERSVLSSASRINRIATQNYGMVYCEAAETLLMPGDESASASLEEQFTQASDPTSADTLQTTSEAGEPGVES
jgi:cell division protein FtsL